MSMNVQHFWTPPKANEGERILGLCVYQNMLVICTSLGVYYAADGHIGLLDHSVYPVLVDVAHDIFRRPA